MQPQCSATRRDGQPCKAPALKDGKCFAHAPGLRQKREAARQAGGRNRATAARLEARSATLVPAVMRPVLHRLLQAMIEVGNGTMEPRRATALASVASAIVRVYEVGQIEERLSALEEGARSQWPARF